MTVMLHYFACMQDIHRAFDFNISVQWVFMYIEMMLLTKKVFVTPANHEGGHDCLIRNGQPILVDVV